MAKKKAEKPVVKKEPVVIVEPSVPSLVRIKVTHEQLVALEKEGKLVGYDKATSEAIVKDRGK